MLVPAIARRADICALMIKHAYDPKYDYFFASEWRDFAEEKIAPSNDWEKLAMVSVSDEGLGYLAASIARSTEVVSSLHLANFGCNPLEFAKDTRLFVRRLMQRYDIIRWSVLIGNPVEKHYDRLCHAIGGRIVGTYTRDCRLLDGSYVDRKLYEWVKA